MFGTLLGKKKKNKTKKLGQWLIFDILWFLMEPSSICINDLDCQVPGYIFLF